MVSFLRGALLLTQDFENLLKRIFHRAVEGEGVLGTAQRSALFNDLDIPENLRAFVNKTQRHAYKVTDEDLESLKASDYSEDAIFEATICTALGVGNRRWETARAALKDTEG